MKIIVYCQHVLGVGHFFRTLEILKALDAHDIVLVTGGDVLPASLPGHVRQVMLPGLMMDERFSRLYSVDPGQGVEDVKKARQQILAQVVLAERPDLFLVERYPFGRKAFRFELDPVLALLAHGILPNRHKVRMIVLTGPYMEKKAAAELGSLAGEGVRVEPFWTDFISLVAAADLSISMAGYNTCMNLVAAGLPALVWPFDQNREQGMRANALSDFADITLLEGESLVPEVLAGIIRDHLATGKKQIPGGLDLGGARAVSHWIKESVLGDRP